MNNEKLHTQAIITLVLGILSLVLLLFGWSSIVGLGCGIAALILGSKVKKASENKEGLGNAGYICGLIGTILSGLEMIIIIIVLFFFGATFNFIKNQQPDIKEANKLIDTIKDYADEYEEKENKKEEVDDSTTTTTTASVNSNSNSNDNSAEISNLKEQLQAKQNELASKKDKVVELQQKISSVIASGDSSQVSSIQSEIKDLNSEIFELGKEISDIQSKISSLQ